MNQRLYVYPLFFVAIFQILPLLRTDSRWYWAQIAQLISILLPSIGAMVFDREFAWVVLAWSLFVLFVVAPRMLVRGAMTRQSTRSAGAAAIWWLWAGRITGGNLGRVYRACSAAARLWSAGNRHAAETVLDELAGQPMPELVRSEIRAMRLGWLVSSRDFPSALAFHERSSNYGFSTADAQTRLLAARAYAETGDIDRALWCLQYAMLSLRVIGPLETQLWTTRVCVAALAGDQTELERLLNSNRPPFRRRTASERFAAWWRGRCALARGDRAVAVRELARAQALTPHRDGLWRDTINNFRDRTEALPETADLSATIAAATPGYAASQRALHLAEQQSAGWHALMHMGSPEGATLVLLVMFACVYLADAIVFDAALQRPLWNWAGNIPAAVRHGEWWRPFTAMFLHAHPLHLGMNGLALWLFGPAVERSIGRWRFLVVFLGAGSLGNALSATMSNYDVSVGASGGIFGVIAAYAVAAYLLDSPLYHSVRRRLLWLIGATVAIDLAISSLEPQVDSLAHAGGFVAGLALALLVYPRRRPQGEPVVDAARAV